MYQLPVTVPVNYATISVEFSVGTMINYTTWIPACQDTSLAMQYGDLTVQILFDDQVIFDQSVDHNVMQCTHRFLDSNELHLKQLKIILTGLQDHHRTTINDIEHAAVMLRIHSVRLEGLNLRLALEDHGVCVYDQSPKETSIPSEYMGRNGYQLLEFTTPVYQWLLDTGKKNSYYYNA
jgi:hypothetical protein